MPLGLIDCLDSNQEVTPDAFVKGNLNYKVWGMAFGIVGEVGRELAVTVWDSNQRQGTRY